MVHSLKNQYSRMFEETFLRNLKLCTNRTKHILSRTAGADEINVIHDLFPQEILSHIPKSVTGVRH